MAVVFLIVSKMVIYVEESLGNGRTISEAKLTASSAKDRTQPSLPAVDGSEALTKPWINTRRS
jgi:hypothetical protein